MSKTLSIHLRDATHDEGSSNIPQTAILNVSCFMHSLYLLLSPGCLSYRDKTSKISAKMLVISEPYSSWHEELT